MLTPGLYRGALSVHHVYVITHVFLSVVQVPDSCRLLIVLCVTYLIPLIDLSF